MISQPTSEAGPGRTAGAPQPSSLIAACVLIALSIFVYMPAMDGEFVFDDEIYLTEDARMGSSGGLSRIWKEVGGADYTHQYYPLTSTVWWLEQRAFGDDPFGYHLGNVLLHALNAILLWRLLRRLSVPGAWVAGAIFAVHPVHVQSVAWISELKNVLSTFFFLSSAGFFLAWLGIGGTKARRHEGTKEEPEAAGIAPASLPFSVPSCLLAFVPYCIGLLLFIAALLSKSATCLLPIALALIVWWKRGRIGLREIAGLAPLVVVGGLFVGMTVYLEARHGGAGGAGFDQGFAERCLIAGRAAWFYATKLVWPADLMLVYPRWDVDAAAWWQWLFPAGVVIVLAALWLLRGRLGRGPAAAAAYFVIGVAPISFVNVAFTRFSWVADHWQYWASMGVVALGAAWLLRAPARPAPRVAAAGVIAVLAVAAWLRAGHYQSARALWSQTVAANGNAWVAHNNLGNVLRDEHRLDDAIIHYRDALRLNAGFAEAHCNLGAAMQERGWPAEAVDHLRCALSIDPRYAKAHYNMGNALQALGKIEDAIASYRRALDIEPRFAKAHNNLGTALLAAGRIGQAMAQYDAALSVRPDYAEAHYNVGIALAAQGRADEAAEAYGRAITLRPDYIEAHNNLGTALLAMKRPGDAVGQFAEAIAIDPRHAGARYNLGVVLASQGRWDAAAAQYRAAIEIDPGFAEAHNGLGVALAAQGSTAGAVSHYLEALRIDPSNEAAWRNLSVVNADAGAGAGAE